MGKRVTALLLMLAFCAAFAACREEITVQSIKFEATPRDSYMVGDAVDESWNQLRVRMSDGSFVYIPGDAEGVQIQADTTTPGEKTATVSYGGKNTTFPYTVFERLPETVMVTGGEIRGYRDGNVKIYKGIPYAADTAGENRWKPPQDVLPWEGVQDCTTFGDSCIQMEQPENDYNVPKHVGMSEDCLSLNVWTTGSDVAGKPVIVFVHGGGAIKGGSSIPVLDGTNIAQKGIVFVTVNYRLGGFSAMVSEELAEEPGAGNYRYLDVIKALQWVQENIGSFGGDAGNVTLCGQSAGSRLVSVLLASPLTEGLIARAVLFSASAIGTDFPTPQEYADGHTLSEQTIDQLRQTPAKDIMKLETNKMAMLDGHVLTDHMEDAFAKGINADVDVMMCVVTGDVGVLLEKEDQNLLEPLRMLVGQQQVMAQYRRAGGSTGTNYVCLFEYAMNGAAICEHTDDLPFWLNNPVSIYDDWDADDYAFAQIATSYLVNFATSGNPNGQGLPLWQPATEDLGYLHLGQDARCVMENLTAQEMEYAQQYYEVD